ncbi:uncharacterized protein K02A2.6-like [Macrosteles quadrilineatus]|uniref:uncharacterized protein K02A2.6-like n=1 Tax=Macrosteles quadrilineatus TaxID=74068 RepID=UPI0023E10BD9|nr:uncharacterized protein K02A2.6-like [Macrosteles quadrilineatus]
MYSPLLGRTWIRQLGVHLNDLDTQRPKDTGTYVNLVSSDTDKLVTAVESKFPEIFSPEIGHIPNVTSSLKLRPQSKPVFFKPRPLPYALRDRVGHDLDKLEQDKIITKIESCDWGSPLVVVPKPDGTLRLCADYKVTVNPQLYDSHYPIPRIDETLHKLRNAKFFCTLDLFKAYLHIGVDEESACVQTISTHKGTYKVNRLSFGIKTAPSIFQKVMEQVLQDLPGVSSYFDDIIVYGSTLDECFNNLVACLERLQTNNLHLNRNKCTFFQESITYLGYVIENNKISKSPAKVSNILNIQRPNSVEEVRKFLGLVTYYSKFIPAASTITYPLRQLLIKNKPFNWTKDCEKAFINIKKEIASDRVVVPFDPDLPVSIACDASPHGISGVLSHIINGEERPIAFVSRSLSKSESQYSQLDREALAIVFSIGKFFNYLYGRKFELITDNQPLTRIFHPKDVPPMTAGRLLRYAVFLRGFEYNIKHRKAEQHQNVDFLSRTFQTTEHRGIDTALNKEEDEIEQNSILQISSINITSDSISKETAYDPGMKDLMKQIKEGANDPIYSTNQGIVFRGERVYIPRSLRSHVLEELHATHIGMVRMKRLARLHCYWPGIDKDIENKVRSCAACALQSKQPTKVFHPWEIPKENFERVHMDYAGPFNGHHFLVVIDAKSKWPEVRITKNAPSTATTIEFLNDIFSTHGYPAVLVSDNATIFTSQEFTDFCRQRGIFQKFIAPGHPATNGLAERYVQTLKTSLKNCAEDPRKNIKSQIQDILFRYRAVPLQCGQPPAELYLNRKIRTKLDALKPPKKNTSLHPGFQQVSRSFKVGERILVRSLDGWKFGKVIFQLGALHYKVKLDNGYIGKRHIDQLKRTSVPETKDKTHSSSSPKENTSSQQQNVTFKDNDLENIEIRLQRREDNNDQLENAEIRLQPSEHNNPQTDDNASTDVPRKSARTRKQRKRLDL